VRELKGENPPSFSLMTTLYELAGKLYQLQPWHVLDENELVLVRDPVSNEVCYCSVMGALGEVFSVHVYIGNESYRMFRKLQNDELSDPGEFFASLRSVSVEFVSRSSLEQEDRRLLTRLGHESGRNHASPLFRAMRPGYLPWFVTDEEGRTLADCMSAVILVCRQVATRARSTYWDRADTYPMVSQVEAAPGEPQYRIETATAAVPREAPLALARLEEQRLAWLHGRDLPVRGVMEVDYLVSPTPVGRKYERKACMHIALAVDGESGLVFNSRATDPEVTPGDALAAALLEAIQSSRALPREVRVRDRRFKASLESLSTRCGLKIKVAALPALDEARRHLLAFLGGAGPGD
jgi:hypothetical protein